MHNTIALHSDFNWIVWALAFLYNSSFLCGHQNWFNNYSETNLPPIDSLDWVKGFEWKGLFVRVESLDKAKETINEIKALNYAFFDYIQVIDCVKSASSKKNNVNLLSNEIVFPFLSYASFGTLVMVVTACIDKYIYEPNDTLINDFSITVLSGTMMSEKSSKKEFYDEFSYINKRKNSEEKIANNDIHLSNYDKDDLSTSLILSKISNNNLIKIIGDDNGATHKDKFKLMLINVHSLIPELLHESNEKIFLVKLNEDKTQKFISHQVSNLDSIGGKLLNEFGIIYNNDEDLSSIENRFDNFKYKILYQKKLTFQSLSLVNSELIFNNFINLAFQQNKKLSDMLEQFDPSNESNVPFPPPPQSICLINYALINKTKMKYPIITSDHHNSISKLNFVYHIEKFCSKLNSKSHTITTSAALKSYMHKYGINFSFLFFFLEKISNKKMNDLIQITILSSIIKKFLSYHESVNYYLKLDLYDKTKTSDLFNVTNFVFDSENEEPLNMNDIKKKKIALIIKAILNDNDPIVFENNFVKFFYNQLSFFTLIKFLKWKILDEEYRFNILSQNTSRKYSIPNLLFQFSIAAKNDPFTFISCLESYLNISIDPFIKHSTSISLENSGQINSRNIIIKDPKVISFINSKEISSYMLSKCVTVNNSFSNLNMSNNNQLFVNNLSISRGNTSINAIPLFNNIIKANNNVSNTNISMYDNSINAIIGGNKNHQRINSNNVTVMQNVNIAPGCDISGSLGNVNNTRTNVNKSIINNIKNNIANVSWKDILSKTPIDMMLPPINYKMLFNTHSINNSKESKLYNYLSIYYQLCKYDILVDWKSSIELIFEGIISHDSQCENELLVALVFSFIHNFFIEDNKAKAKEIITKMKEIQKKTFWQNYSLISVLSLFEAMTSEKCNDKEENYSKCLTNLLLEYGDTRGKRTMGHPLMMVPLYKLAKTTSILDNASNEYIKEMFKSIEYNILNYEGASNIRDNNTKPYFFNENTIYAKHFEKKKKVVIENGYEEPEDIDENIEESECFDINYDMNNIEGGLSQANYTLTVNDCPRWKFFPFPPISDVKHSYKQIFHTKEYIIYFMSSLFSVLSFSNITNYCFNEDFLSIYQLSKSNGKEDKSLNTQTQTTTSTNNIAVGNSSINNTKQPTNQLSYYLNDLILDKLSYKNKPADGIVLSFGHNSHNETSHDSYEMLTLPRLIFKLTHCIIKKIFCGAEHTIAISSEYDAYAWGNNSQGQCGTGTEEIAKSPTRVKISPAVLSASCGSNFTYFLTKDTNELYFCGYHHETKAVHRIPNKFIFSLAKDDKISNVSSGESHSLLLTTTKKVFSWGYGGDSQLGISSLPSSSFVGKPKLITDLCCINITSLSCGNSHCLATDADGKVYGWGLSSHGELGLDFCKDTYIKDQNCILKCHRKNPVRITTMNAYNVKKTVCGSNFSLFLTENDEVFACGLNNKMQLGIQKDNNSICNDITIPRSIDAFYGMKVHNISCGESHCLAIVSDNVSRMKMVWGWGSNLYGQIGIGNQISQAQPKPISFFMDYSGGVVKDIQCGKNFSIVLLAKKKNNENNELTDKDKDEMYMKYNIFELFSIF